MNAALITAGLNLLKQAIPVLWNDKDETKFNVNALVKVVTSAVLVYFLGAEGAEFAIELARGIK